MGIHKSEVISMAMKRYWKPTQSTVRVKW